MRSTQLPNNITPSQIIFIVGPTATGKSALAFELAKQRPANILVADSRQVYKDLVITSGADIPAEFTSVHESKVTFPFFRNKQGVEIHGASFLNVSQTWSAGAFYHLAKDVLRRTLHQTKVLIIVGGTGLYTHSLLFSPEQILPPSTSGFRKKLQKLSVTELQKIFAELNPQAEAIMNNSDWNNPRRLIRAIETFQNPTPKADINSLKNEITIDGKKVTPTWIGLKVDKELLENKIRQRVEQRIADGAIAEVEQLLTKVENKKANIFTTTGVKEITAYLNQQIEKQELIQLWTTREFKYAKRQLTWFKKRKYIEWFGKNSQPLNNRTS